MTMDRNRQRLVEKLQSLDARYRQLMRGRTVPSPKALRVRTEMQTLRSQIDAIDRDAAERLALEKAPVDEVLQVIAIPLLADVMNDIVASVDGMLMRHGCQETVFGDYVRTIRRATMAMVDTLARTEDRLPDLLSADDTLVDAIEKKLMTFIRQHVNITK